VQQWPTSGGFNTAMEITGLAYDSRKAMPGALFIAVPGTYTDGRAYLGEAAQRGALAALGHPQPPPSPGPGMFALASPDQLRDLLQAAGFVDVEVDAVTVERCYPSVTSYLEETLDLSMMFREAWPSLPNAVREAVPAKLADVAAPWLDGDGVLSLPGRCLVAAAQA